MPVSPERGGAGASFFAKVAVAETAARACFPCAFALINMQGAVTRIEREGTAEQIARYLPGLMKGSLICAPSLSEPEAGSDFGAIRTLATKVPGGWEISGEKAWVTNGAIANLLVMYAQTDPEAGGKGIASFMRPVRGWVFLAHSARCGSLLLRRGGALWRLCGWRSPLRASVRLRRESGSSV